MSREEAISKAINIVSYFEAHFAKSKEAREDAANIIEALEQEPCEDAISRESVMAYIKKMFTCGLGKEKSLGCILKYVGKLPSVVLKTELEPCENAVSRKAVLDLAINVPIAKIVTEDKVIYRKVVFVDEIEQLPPVKPAEKVGQCKQCKWWKDSDGAYRRGMRAESKCPMNTQKVYEGDGYCYLYEPKMQEVEGNG